MTPPTVTHEEARAAVNDLALDANNDSEVRVLARYIAQAEQTERERDELKAKLESAERLAAIVREHGVSLRVAAHVAGKNYGEQRFKAAAKALAEALK